MGIQTEMELAFDSSSVILLAKANLLRQVCSLTNVKMPAQVEAEVMAGIEGGRQDALFVRELVREGKIKIVEVGKKPAEEVSLYNLKVSFRLGPGEAAAIVLALAGKTPLVTDDNSARKIGKFLGLEVLSSLDFPIILCLKSIIGYEEARTCLGVLGKEGWFGESVLLSAFEALETVKGGKK